MKFIIEKILYSSISISII